MKPTRKWRKRLLYGLLILFIGINAFAAIHGYRFTHFAKSGTERTRDEDKMDFGQKLATVLFGVSIPKPVNDRTPAPPFSTVWLDRPGTHSAWYLAADSPLGTVIVFHGYGGCRSGMLAKAERLRAMHYNCLVPDFSGAGGSEGSSCSIGYFEADEVRAWYRHLRQHDAGPVYLMGQSMGAAAIMKAMHDTSMPVAGLILECPYGTMLQTVKNRFHTIGLPEFPMAQLLVFWGGTLQGFNAFSLEPEVYAKSLRTPVLLIRGSLDKRVTLAETETIYRNLQGRKRRLELAGAGHNDMLERGGASWNAAVRAFLQEFPAAHADIPAKR